MGWVGNLEAIAVWMKPIHFEYISVIKNQTPSKYLLLRQVIKNQRLARSFYFTMDCYFIVTLDLLILVCISFKMLQLLLIPLPVSNQLREMIL